MGLQVKETRLERYRWSVTNDSDKAVAVDVTGHPTYDDAHEAFFDAAVEMIKVILPSGMKRKLVLGWVDSVRRKAVKSA